MRQNCWFSWQQRWTCQISTVSLWVFACHNDQTCALTMFYHKLRCNERGETCITTKIVFEKDITCKRMIKDAYLTSTRDLGIRQWLTYWFWKRTWTSNNIDIDLVYFFGGGLGCLIPLEDEETSGNQWFLPSSIFRIPVGCPVNQFRAAATKTVNYSGANPRPAKHLNKKEWKRNDVGWWDIDVPSCNQMWQLQIPYKWRFSKVNFL